MFVLLAFCLNAICGPVVFEGADVCEATSLESVGGGKLYLSVLSGEYGGKSELHILVSSNSGKSFSEPVLTLKQETLSVSNGILWKDSKGVLWLFYTETMGYFDGKGTLKAIRCTNPTDSAPQWSSPVELGYGVCTGRPVETDGRIVLPFALWSRSLISAWPNLYGNLRQNEDKGLYSELDSYRGAGVYVSDNGGELWTCIPSVVKVPSKVAGRYPDPQLFTCPDGGIMMLLRSNATGEAYKSYSYDKGETWSAPEFFIIHPDLKMTLCPMPSGKLMMVRNNAFDQYTLAQNYGLFAYLSDDGGKTWYGNLQLSSDAYAFGPSVCVGEDGACITAFSHYTKGIRTVSVAVMTEKHIDSSINEITPMKSAPVAMAETSDFPSKKGARKWCQEPVRVGTYNIQVSRAAQWDPRADWTKRLPAVTALIDEYDFDILCSQEPYRGQMDDLIGYYHDKYNWVGRTTAADSLETMAAYNPIFYRKERFEIKKWGIEWFTAIPGTTGYDAATPRNMTWAHFLDKPSGKEFFCISAHFDHKGKEAKNMAAYIVLDVVKRLSGNLPVIICGDFNSLDFSEAYNILADSGHLADSYVMCADPINGDYTSIPSYKAKEDIPKNKNHLDHIFYTPDNSMILYWELIINDYNGIYGSDHLPICVDWKFSN